MVAAAMLSVAKIPSATSHRQHPIGIYIADFACVRVRLVIEVDGGTHRTDAERAYDRVREAYLKRRGWRVVRFWNMDVYRRLNDVLDRIEAEVEAI